MLSDLLTLVGIPAVDPSSPSAQASQPVSQRQGRAKTAPIERNQYRRAQSADTGPRARLQHTRQTKLTGSAATLTAEESRILTQLRDDFDRRGDFNRIFPTEDSWSLYGDFVETLNSSPALASPGTNFNRTVHDRLFPLLATNRNNEPSVASVASAAVAATAQTAATGSNSRLPPRAPNNKRLTLRSVARATSSANGPVRGYNINSVHPNWRSLNEESDPDLTSFYEEGVLQPLTLDNRKGDFIFFFLLEKWLTHASMTDGVKVNKKSPESEDSPVKIKREIKQLLENRHILRFGFITSFT